MRTSKEWWDGVKNDQSLFMDWLRKQYHGEATAAVRIRKFLSLYGGQSPNPMWVGVVESIAKQEETHAKWIGKLLRTRGEEPKTIESKDERYWNKTLSGITSWETGCAVAAHAEKMRLDRIRTIVEDQTAPEDVRAVFSKILFQEQFHEKAFRNFTSQEAMNATLENHKTGASSLGLVT